MSLINHLYITYEEGKPSLVRIERGNGIDANDSTQQNIHLYSLEHEEALLSGIIQNQSFWPDVIGNILADDFFYSENKQLFQSMIDLSKLGSSLDVITLSEKLDHDQSLERVGGLERLIELARKPCPISVREHLEIIIASSLIRKLVDSTVQSIRLNLPEMTSLQ